MTSSTSSPDRQRTFLAPTHEHAWDTESRHPTSEGWILYVRCAGCGTRRVDLQPHPLTPPAALSQDVGTPGTLVGEQRAVRTVSADPSD